MCAHRAAGHAPYDIPPVAGAAETDPPSAQLDAAHTGCHQNPHPVQREGRGRAGNSQSSRQPQGTAKRDTVKPVTAPYLEPESFHLSAALSSFLVARGHALLDQQNKQTGPSSAAEERRVFP